MSSEMSTASVRLVRLHGYLWRHKSLPSILHIPLWKVMCITFLVQFLKILKNYYSRPRVIQSLRTTSRRHAVHSSRLLSLRLEDYWHDLRLRNTEPPCAHLLTREHLQGSSTVITLTQALELHLSVKGVGYIWNLEPDSCSTEIRCSE